jgi:predicted transcriptional regulator
MFEELEELFESSTIKPTFEKVHVILALFLFGKNPDGIGRYRLRKNLLIGSGTARSLVKKLKEKVNFITVVEENIRKGHILTEKGLDYLKRIKKTIPLLEKAEPKVLKDIIIRNEDIHAYFCLVKGAAKKVSSGIEQRDAAIKVGASGATCLLYKGNNLQYPSSPIPPQNSEELKLNDKIKNYFETKVSNFNTELEKDDVIIIGLGETPEKARLAALNSALTLM